MAKHLFLSNEWFAIVEEVVEEHGTQVPVTTELVMNLVVTDTPFGDCRQLHVGARNGRGHWGVGHVPDPDVTITTDYETAREILFSADPQAGLAALLEGRVKVQGDLAKLMAAQAAGTQAGASALAEAIQAVTE